MKDGSGLFDPLARYVGVLLQQGRAQLDADEDEFEYVRLRRLAVAMLESLDQALGLSLFEPVGEPPEAGASQADQGTVLVELLADVANALSSYTDRIAAEERLRARRRAVAGAAALLVAFAWYRRRAARA